MFNQIIAFVLNNLLLVAAGGFVAAYLAWRMWKKVDGLMRSMNSWQELAFWAVKLIVIVAVLFKVGSWIYGTVNQAVIAAVNSPSIQTTGQALVDLGGAVDTLVGFDGSNGGGLMTADFSTGGGSVSLFSAGAESIATDLQGAFNAVTELAPAEVAPASAFAQPAAVDPAPSAVAGNYVVARGDSLAAIAKAIYGDSNEWVKLCQANQDVLGGNCNQLRSGMKLTIPAAGATVIPLVKAGEAAPGWGQDLVKPAPVTYGPVVRNAPRPTPTTVEPAYDLNAKNFWSQFQTAGTN